MSHQVFISYSSRDKNAADAVCSVLERNGIRCWIAPRDVIPGAVWGAAIVAAIRECEVMVLVFSGAANASPQIEREVERVINKGSPIIPLRIEDVQPHDSLEYFISASHWLDAFTPPFEDHLNKLVEVIHYILKSKAGLEHSADAETKTIAQAAVAAVDPRIKDPEGRASDEKIAAQDDVDLSGSMNAAVSATANRSRARVPMIAGAALIAAALVAGGLVYRSSSLRAHEVDVAAWSRAIAADRIRDYDAYLTAQPGGDHADEAKARRTKRVQDRLVGTLPGNSTGVTWAHFTPDSQAVLSNASFANRNAQFVLYSLAGQPFRTFGGAGGVRGAPLTNDGKRLVAFGGSTELRWWQFDDPSKTWVHHNKAGIEWINELSFSPDGQSYAIACSDGTIRLRDVNIDRELAVFAGHQGWVWSVAFSPDGRWLLSGGADKTARLWDVAGREQRAILGAYKDIPFYAIFSPDSKRVYITSWQENKISEWGIESGHLLKELRPYNSAGAGFQISPCEKLLFSYWGDGTIVATELATGRNALTFQGPISSIWSFQISPDQRTLAIGGVDPLVRLYDISDVADRGSSPAL